MIKCEQLFEIFEKNNLLFFTGVPDSTFKEWMKFLSDKHNNKLTNIIACNECEAVAIASGYHLATNEIGVVYMQNSGQGKTINPLTSLCDPEVYSIPLVLMIGWRGEPNIEDEPQHKKMGRITLDLLNTLEIPHKILSPNIEDANKTITEMKQISKIQKKPVAIIIKRGIFEKYETKENQDQSYEMNREDAIKIIVDNLEKSDVIISTTGKTSRELFEYRKTKNERPRDFYTVGSMGCSSSMALGIALQKPDKKIFVFDGDGSIIMQLGSLTTIGHYKPKNFHHIIFDNESHDSTGGQPTVSSTINFQQLALSTGYTSSKIIQTKKDLIKSIKEMKDTEGPYMLIIKINKGSREDLSRPSSSPIENKEEFMNFLSK